MLMNTDRVNVYVLCILYNVLLYSLYCFGNCKYGEWASVCAGINEQPLYIKMNYVSENIHNVTFLTDKNTYNITTSINNSVSKTKTNT